MKCFQYSAKPHLLRRVKRKILFFWEWATPSSGGTNTSSPTLTPVQYGSLAIYWTSGLLHCLPHFLGRIASTRILVDAAYCYRPSSMVCRSVTLVIPAKVAEAMEMSFGLWARMGPRNHVLDGGQIPWREDGGRPTHEVGYCDSLWWSVKKRLNRSRCRSGYGLGWAQGSICIRSCPDSHAKGQLFG